MAPCPPGCCGTPGMALTLRCDVFARTGIDKSNTFSPAFVPKWASYYDAVLKGMPIRPLRTGSEWGTHPPASRLAVGDHCGLHGSGHRVGGYGCNCDLQSCQEVRVRNNRRLDMISLVA